MNDKIKEKLLNLREIFKILLLSIVALMTGIITIIYNVSIHKIPFYSIMLAEVSLLLVILIAFITFKIYVKMETLIEEMDNG